jgi:16S rRNA (cytosine967-C5)-methyltransferase
LKYLRSRYFVALELLRNYNYPKPFHLEAKAFFKGNNKYGSKDRKAILEICYAYFRKGNLFPTLQLEESLLLSITFLPLFDAEDWNKLAAELGYNWILPDSTFEDQESLINWLSTCTSLDTQGVLYRNEALLADFNSINTISSIGFRPKVWAKNHKLNDGQDGLPPGCFILEEGDLPGDFEQIQDLASQSICSKIEVLENQNVWDVCSGAGGKSLNLLQRGIGNFYLSDIREQILNNASQRIRQFGYKASFGTFDAQKTDNLLNFKGVGKDFKFDVIIADVPCSGSGTWFRTPEHFANFDYNSIEDYKNRQKQIAVNSWPYLKSGGLFYYITCSVFKAENSEVKSFIMNTLDCELKEEFSFNGLIPKSDSMYMCCVVKN